MPTFGSLFAGIGGMDLGLERAGWECAWQVEINPYARRVLEKHWPNVRRWDDVRTFPPAGEWGCDLIAGGFPCQDISNAGKRAGIEGRKSGLWSDFARIIGVVRPRFVLVENVAALLDRGMGRVLGDLAALGFDAEWDVIPAGAFGAPHIRSRIFVAAYPTREARINPALQRPRATIAHLRKCQPRRGFGLDVPGSYWQTPEPAICEVDDGISGWAHAVSAYGNAVVPQVAEWIGRQLISREENQPQPAPPLASPEPQTAP